MLNLELRSLKVPEISLVSASQPVSVTVIEITADRVVSSSPTTVIQSDPTYPVVSPLCPMSPAIPSSIPLLRHVFKQESLPDQKRQGRRESQETNGRWRRAATSS